jgi:hypothetical protein
LIDAGKKALPVKIFLPLPRQFSQNFGLPLAKRKPSLAALRR